MLTDQEILDLFLKKDQSAIAAVYDRYGGAALKLAENITGDEADAEECVNDACLALWNNIPPLVPQNLSAYFLKTVRNISINRLRYNKAAKRNANMEFCFEEIEEMIPDNNTDGQPGHFSDNEITEHINKFLSGADEKDRVLFISRYFLFCEMKDLQAKTGLSSVNIRVRLSRTRKRLKAYLEKQGVIL